MSDTKYLSIFCVLLLESPCPFFKIMYNKYLIEIKDVIFHKIVLNFTKTLIADLKSVICLQRSPTRTTSRRRRTGMELGSAGMFGRVVD